MSQDRDELPRRRKSRTQPPNEGDAQRRAEARSAVKEYGRLVRGAERSAARYLKIADAVRKAAHGQNRVWLLRQWRDVEDPDDPDCVLDLPQVAVPGGPFPERETQREWDRVWKRPKRERTALCAW